MFRFWSITVSTQLKVAPSSFSSSCRHPGKFPGPENKYRNFNPMPGSPAAEGGFGSFRFRATFVMGQLLWVLQFGVYGTLTRTQIRAPRAMDKPSLGASLFVSPEGKGFQHTRAINGTIVGRSGTGHDPLGKRLGKMAQGTLSAQAITNDPDSSQPVARIWLSISHAAAR